MAAGVKLTLEFDTASGTTSTYSYNYAKSDVSGSQVKALMDTMITNGAIFKNVPVTKKSAKLVVTTESPIDIDA